MCCTNPCRFVGKRKLKLELYTFHYKNLTSLAPFSSRKGENKLSNFFIICNTAEGEIFHRTPVTASERTTLNH